MGFFSVSRTNVAISTTADSLSLWAASGRKFLVSEFAVGGQGTASAANEMDLLPTVASGVTSGASIVPQPFDPDSQASSTLCCPGSWGTQPSASGTPFFRLPVNANGGLFRWVAKPRQEIVVRYSATVQLSVRAGVGSSNCSMHLIFEEL